MRNFIQRIKGELSTIYKLLEKLDSDRERMLMLTREVSRRCRTAIFALHREDYAAAEHELLKAKELLGEIYKLKTECPQIYFSGAVSSAQAEYIEAVLLYSILQGAEPLSFEELRVDPYAYLAGLGDFIGELRRYVLDLLRKGLINEAWNVFNVMEELYVELSKFSYPEALTPGLRHKVDVARALLENTRNDIMFFERSQELIEKIEQSRRALEYF
ncbi:MAG: hypothetical protein LM590_04940 [Thermofilum sp.]|jgi:translin|nr:hypothetical protein [Thermofilum sp.]